MIQHKRQGLILPSSVRCESPAESRVTVSAGRRFSACLSGAALFLPDLGRAGEGGLEELGRTHLALLIKPRWPCWLPLEGLLLVSNQSWVCSPGSSHAFLLTPGCGEGRCRVYCRHRQGDQAGRAQRPDGDFQPEGGGCGARDQLVAVLLIGWWWGHQESV